jgi:hypothetical protein
MAWASIDSLDSPASGAFDFPSLSLGSYKVVRLEFINIRVTTDGTDLQLTAYISSAEVTTGYHWAFDPTSTSGSSDADSGVTQAAWFLNQNNANWDTGNAAAESFAGRVVIASPASSALHKMINITSIHVGPTGNAITSIGFGYLADTGAIGGFKVKGSSDLVSGRVRIWGMT